MTTILSERINGMFDYRIIAAIVAITVAFHVIGSSFFFDQDEFNIVDVMIFTGPIFGMGLCGIYLKRYGVSRYFEKSILMLGLALASILIGDVIYLYHDISGDTNNIFLSYADVFYFLFTPLIGSAVVLSMKRLCHKVITRRSVTIVSLSMIVAVSAFVITSSSNGVESGIASEKEELDWFVFGLVSILGNSIVVGLILYHVTLLEASRFGLIRMTMLVGMLLSVMADIWYYSLEVLGQYTPMHLVDTMWFTAWIIIGYSVYLKLMKL